MTVGTGKHFPSLAGMVAAPAKRQMDLVPSDVPTQHVSSQTPDIKTNPTQLSQFTRLVFKKSNSEFARNETICPEELCRGSHGDHQALQPRHMNVLSRQHQVNTPAMKGTRYRCTHSFCESPREATVYTAWRHLHTVPEQKLF